MVNDTISLTLHDTIAARRLLGLPFDRVIGGQFSVRMASPVSSDSSGLCPQSLSLIAGVRIRKKRIIKKKEPRTRGDTIKEKAVLYGEH